MAPISDSPAPDDVCSARPAGEGVLTGEEVARYHEEGYLALQSFIDVGEVQRIRAIYDRLFASRAGRSDGNLLDLAGVDEDDGEARLPQILGPSKYAPELLETQAVLRVKRVVTQLLGPTAEMTFDHAINKPPFHGAETPWHQDEAYWDPDFMYSSLSIWLPLQEVGIDNGCMHFIPGSHGGGVVPHHPIGGDSRVHGLEAVPGSIDVSTAVACPLPAGGATIHDSKTLHYAPGNRTSDHRRAYIVAGAAPKTPAVPPREFPWRAAQQTMTARAKRARRHRGDGSE